MKNKLFVLEGADGIGKSTQTEILLQHYNAKKIIQPNGENAVGFLREEVKQNVIYNPFERQLLHTVSHVVDAFTMFEDFQESIEHIKPLIEDDVFGVGVEWTKLLYWKRHADDPKTFIMDRCHASAYAYGKTQGLDEFRLEILMRIHRQVYAKIFKNYDVRIAFLDRSTRYKEQTTDEFEKMIKWSSLKEEYQSLVHELMACNTYLFKPGEKVMHLNLDGIEKEEISDRLIKFFES